jgi:Uma2 family endonuclease
MATALVSLEEYLRTSYKPDVDYVDGELLERNVGQYDHGKIQSIIAFLFTLNAKDWQTDCVVEQRICTFPGNVRICDVTVLRTSAPREQVTLTPPLICIEIMSPDDRLSRAKLVLADYLAMGVENIWLIDPQRRAAYTFDAAGLHETDTTNLVVPGTPIKVDLTEAFAALD